MAFNPDVLPHSSRLFELEYTLTRVPWSLLHSLLDLGEKTLQVYKSSQLIALSNHFLQHGVLFQQVSVDLLSLRLFTHEVPMEVRVGVLQVRQNLPESV